MKKRVVLSFGLILLLSGTSNLLAYKYKITNDLEKRVKVTLKTSLAGRGNKKSVQLNPNETKTVKFRGIQAVACLYSYRINGGKKQLVTHPVIGYFSLGIAGASEFCRDRHLWVIRGKDRKGNLVEGLTTRDPEKVRLHKLKLEQERKRRQAKLEQLRQKHKELQ